MFSCAAELKVNRDFTAILEHALVITTMFMTSLCKRLCLQIDNTLFMERTQAVINARQPNAAGELSLVLLYVTSTLYMCLG